MAKVVMIDNYDSFTYNLEQYLGELGAQVQTFRNDQISIAAIEEMRPDHLVLSPGPGRPEGAGICNAVIRHFAGEIPLLGVCLGHQCIAQVFGGAIIQATQLMHGKTSPILHNEQGLFAGLPNPLTATRYHSLIVAAEELPACLEINAWTSAGEIMGLQHRHFPVYGVQFHPESILTSAGKQLLANFLAA